MYILASDLFTKDDNYSLMAKPSEFCVGNHNPLNTYALSF